MTPKPMLNFFSGVKDSDDSPSDEAANNSPLSESEQVGLKLVRSNLFLFYIYYFFPWLWDAVTEGSGIQTQILNGI